MKRLVLRRPAGLGAVVPWGLVVGLAACAPALRAPSGPPVSPLPAGRVALRYAPVDGGVDTLGALRGKVVLVSVIATWAATGLVEVPELKALHAAHPRADLEILTLVLDDRPEMARIFRRTFEVPYVVATVEDRAAFTGEEGPFGSIRIIPSSFLLDRDGRIALRMEGTWPEGSLARAVTELIERTRP